VASINKKHPLHNDNERVSAYLTNIAAVNESTAIKYNERLKKFGLYVSTHYNNSSVDNFVILIKKHKIDVYNILGIRLILPSEKPNNTIWRPAVSFRKVLDGILFVLRTGCQWKMLPKEYGSGSTCHRRFQQWSSSKVFERLWTRLLKEYDQSAQSNKINSVAITSDNSKIVSGSYDKTIRVWDLNTGKLLNTLEGHTKSVNSVAITIDNSKVVSRSNDKTIRVWDLHQGKYYFSGKFDELISSIALSNSGNIMVLGDSNGNLHAGKLYAWSSAWSWVRLLLF